MATSEQIKTLIKSHYLEEDEHFYSIALQVAAHEAKQGHMTLANEIRSIVEKRYQNNAIFISLPPELMGLISFTKPKTPLKSLVISSQVNSRVIRILKEFKEQNKLKSYGLQHRRKILLIGPPGTGKTLTANILSKELNLPLFTIQVDQLVTKFMGETSAKLKLIFNFIEQERGVFFFDEFDAIGSKRSMDNDVGEMRRVLNSFLQFIEQNQSDSLIIAATNFPELLDHALFRRFDDVIQFTLPEENARKQLIKNNLEPFIKSKYDWDLLISKTNGMSHAEIDMACKDAIKNSILFNKNEVVQDDLLFFLLERGDNHYHLGE